MFTRHSTTRSTSGMAPISQCEFAKLRSEAKFLFQNIRVFAIFRFFLHFFAMSKIFFASQFFAKKLRVGFASKSDFERYLEPSIRRKSRFYFHNLLLPCILISMLSPFVFLLPADSGEKVSLGVTILIWPRQPVRDCPSLFPL